MSNHNCNSRELLDAIALAEGNGIGIANPIVRDFAIQHPTKFVRSVEEHTGTKIVRKVRKKRSSNRAVNLMMEDDGGQKIPAIKLIRSLTGMGLAESKRAVESGCLKIYSNTTILRPRDGVLIDCPRTGEVMTEKVATELLKAMQKAWHEIIGVRPPDSFPSMRMVPAK